MPVAGHLLLPVEAFELPKLQDADNAALLALCAAGDQEAWAALVARYENLVYSVALNAGLAEDEADDVFQQVWLEVHRSLGRIHNPQGLPRWLIVSTRRLSYKLAVRNARKVSDVSHDMVDPAALPDEQVERYERRRALEAALDRIDATCSRLLRLLFFHPEDASYRDISRRTGLAVGSIGPIRARCLERLRKILETPA